MNGSGPSDWLASLVDKISPTAFAQSYANNDFAYDELWNDPANLVGSPRNRVMDSSRIGTVLPESNNFNMAIPIVSLGGRGVGASLTLYYNSRVWFKHGSAITFDAIESRPSPGFSLGFGRLVTYGPSNALKYLWIDADATRHYLGQGGNASQTVTLQTNDGSHMTYVGNAAYNGTLYGNDGSKLDLGVVNNRMLPYRITDSNGNYITIAYKQTACDPNCSPCSNCDPTYPALMLDYVTDTMGRIIQCNYNSNLNLVSITAPGFGGTAQNPVTTTVAQFDYESRSVSSSLFTGLTVENIPAQSSDFIKHVYMPATGTGYTFSYSAFGMIYNASGRRQMSINGSGVISDGVESNSVNFNYQTASTPALTNAPAFTQRTENATNAPQAIYSYSNSPGFQTKTFTTTLPDTSTLNLTRSTNTLSVANGLLTQTEIKTSGGASMEKSVITYANDPGGQPQVANVVSYDDGTPSPNQTKIDYDYDSYGNVANTREYGFQVSGLWKVRRRSHNAYKSDASYVNAYLRNLVIESDVYDALLDTNDANDVLMEKTIFTYDDYAAMGGMEEYRDAQGNLPPPPPGHDAGYNASYTVRGNVTGTTKWYDLTNNLSYTRLRKIDVFGNTVKEQLACCNQQTQMASQNYYWAAAEQMTKGGAGGPQLTYGFNYDFNTMATKWNADANNQQTQYGYDAALRQTSTVTPGGRTTTTTYNDGLLTAAFTITYDGGDTQATTTTTTENDGWGRVIKETNMYGGQVNTTYNAMGQMASVSNPFTAGSTPVYWTSYTYDALGRKTLVTLPDTQTLQTIYNGNSVTEIDQVTRKMQRLTDGLGRLVTANEQDASGLLTQATNYTYDALGNLTQVNQGNQLRTYKFDALSRRTAEKVPEQGDPTQANQMTTTFTYTDFNAVATRTDARGVITTNTYDTLNRLTQVSYNTVSGVTTAPAVTYNYDIYNATIANGKLIRVGVGADYEERYTFDTKFRVASTVRTIGTRSYTTAYAYNAGDQLTLTTYPSGQLLYYRHDSHGMTSSLGNYPSGGSGTDYVTGHSHDIAGQLSSVSYGNGVTEQYGYDPARMQMTSHKAGTTSPYTNRMDLTYDYTAKAAGQMGVGSTVGNAGQLMNVSGTINGTSETAAYTYDNYSRLVTSDQTSNASSAQRRFAYDRWGNRTGVWNATSGGTQIQSVSNQTVSFPGTGSAPTNRITSVTSGATVNYSYDANGNMTNDGVHSYTYDSENRLVNVDPGGGASYAYDHQNRRYKTTVGSIVTHYVWQGQNVLAEHNGGTGAVIVNYIYAGTRMILSGPYYLLSDQLSVRLILNSSAAVKGQQGHLPFGEDFGETGTQQQKQHFTSYERDPQSGTDYAVNRAYSFGVGRFQSADPFQSSGDNLAPQGWNRYAYVANAPADFVDPLGLLRAEPLPGDSCGGLGDGGTGGGDDEPVKCTVQVYDRLIEAAHGIPIPGARHGYILFTASILGIETDRSFYEGQKDGQRLIASSATHKKENGKPGYLPADQPDRDRKDGEVSGIDVCAWIAILEFDVDRVNSVYIRYRLFGPNSTSVLRYMLQSLPTQFNMPFMIGYGSKLPGVE